MTTQEYEAYNTVLCHIAFFIHPFGFLDFIIETHIYHTKIWLPFKPFLPSISPLNLQDFFLRSTIGSGNDIVSQLFVKTTLVELRVKDFNNLYIAHIM